jgi:hypothetical protein
MTTLSFSATLVFPSPSGGLEVVGIDNGPGLAAGVTGAQPAKTINMIEKKIREETIFIWAKAGKRLKFIIGSPFRKTIKLV